MTDRIDSVSNSKKVDSFAKKRSAKRATLAREVGKKSKELQVRKLKLLEKIKRNRI